MKNQNCFHLTNQIIVMTVLVLNQLHQSLLLNKKILTKTWCQCHRGIHGRGKQRRDSQGCGSRGRGNHGGSNRGHDRSRGHSGAAANQQSASRFSVINSIVYQTNLYHEQKFDSDSS